MRLVRPLLLTLIASVSTAATVAALTGGFSSSSSSSETEALLNALLEGDHSATRLPQQSSDQTSEQERNQATAIASDDTTIDPLLRVALLSQQPVRVVQPQGQSTCSTMAGEPVSPARLKRLLTGFSQTQLRCGTAEGTVNVNGRTYQGIIHLFNRGQGWMAVNEINMERYVSSVVGAEMPSAWNEEALKAQAVAARSYGLVHLIRPASSDWNLGDTTRWQAYAGQASSTARTRKAAEATRGLVLSHQGGLVESLYAATQAIVDEAHSHLGASMSQHGAQQLAQQGLTYNQILDRYYNGASLARIRRDG